jgi:type IV secretion system protein VirB9
VKVFDDGKDTYFSFRAEEDLPAIFAVDGDGGEAVVNTRARDGYVVVDRIARGFVLRRGKDVTHIYNDGFRVEEASALKPRKKEPWWRR